MSLAWHLLMANRQEDLKPVERELRAFLQALPGLLADGHEGRHALVKDDQVVSVWDTFEDGYQAGCERFGWGVQFLVQPIDRKFLGHAWPEGVVDRQGKASA